MGIVGLFILVLVGEVILVLLLMIVTCEVYGFILLGM